MKSQKKRRGKEGNIFQKSSRLHSAPAFLGARRRERDAHVVGKSLQGKSLSIIPVSNEKAVFP